MKKRRLSAALLTLALSLSLAAPAAAWNSGSLVSQKRAYTSAFTDTRGAWCEAAVQTVYEAGLMDGKSATTFDPGGSLTYAQITVIVARLHSLLHGGNGAFAAPAAGEAWYLPAAAYLQEHVDEETEAGAYLLWDLSFLGEYADQPCDRYDFVWYLAAILPESALSPLNSMTQLPDTEDVDILRFYQAGILTGSDAYGTFQGYDSLNRGQAAAMLARVVDPAQRVKFTPQALVMSQAVLGLSPETALLSVDGYAVTAEAYTYFLCQNIAAAQLENYFSYYDRYPEYLEAYWLDSDYDGTFSDYLLEKHGIDVDAPIAWNTPDKGGMTPAQKVRQDTLTDVKTLAVLLNHQGDYPLTAAQKAEIQQAVPAIYGFSADLSALLAGAEYLTENLTAKHVLTPAQLSRYLAENGYVYGQCLTIYKGDERGYDYASDQEAKEAAGKVRQQIAAHLDDTEYVEYLLWRYSEDYAISPTLISISELSAANQSTLKALSTGQISPVLTEDDRYLAVLKLDPSSDPSLSQSAASIPAQTQLLQWADGAKLSLTPAYNAVDVGAAAAAYLALNG